MRHLTLSTDSPLLSEHASGTVLCIEVKPNVRNRTRQTMRVKGKNDRDGKRKRAAENRADYAVQQRLSMPDVFKRYGPILEELPPEVRADWIERLISAPHERGPLSKWSWAVSRKMRSHWKRAAAIADRRKLC
jgi:hypothetical protein